MSKNVKIDLNQKKILKKVTKLAEGKAASIQAEREYKSRINESLSSFTDHHSGITYKRVCEKPFENSNP